MTQVFHVPRAIYDMKSDTKYEGCFYGIVAIY